MREIQKLDLGRIKFEINLKKESDETHTENTSDEVHF